MLENPNKFYKFEAARIKTCHSYGVFDGLLFLTINISLLTELETHIFH